MQYLGGKYRQGKMIARIISPYLINNITYIEPFCGAMGVASRVAKFYCGPMILSDNL